MIRLILLFIELNNMGKITKKKGLGLGLGFKSK